MLVVVFREAYKANILPVWYHSIDIFCILPHVKFKAGLSIWIWEKQGSSA
jgi:hypothetical protein